MKAFSLLEGLIVLCVVGVVGAVGYTQLGNIESSASNSIQSVSDTRTENVSDLEKLLSEEISECSSSQ